MAEIFKITYLKNYFYMLISMETVIIFFTYLKTLNMKNNVLIKIFLSIKCKFL